MQKSNSDKYSYETIMNPKKLKKGQSRWNQVELAVGKIDAGLLDGPILDFGSGNGYFLFEGLKRGRNIWGIDILQGKIQRYRMLVDYSSSSFGSWKKRAVVGSGTVLPFKSECFSICTSWWVMEHIPNPVEVLQELVRVTRTGGVVSIRAQDAASGWEGHCKIPWIPFLPKQFERAWMKGFGVSPKLRQGVYDITQEQVIDILQKCGCEVFSRMTPTQPLPDILRERVESEEEALRLARKAKKAMDRGDIVERADGLYVYAKKLP